MERKEEWEVRKGPWTQEEDSLLLNYVTIHGEGHWNSVARYAGLKRTGKSCRLRWLNYLRPDVRRGNLTLQEQLLILDLHSRWGNRWSRIAAELPGRTDNEIKNYWRTRVQKQAKQLNCDVNSPQFRHAMRHVWIPRLMERLNASSPLVGSSSSSTSTSSSSSSSSSLSSTHHHDPNPMPESTFMNSDPIPDCYNQAVFAAGTMQNETSAWELQIRDGNDYLDVADDVLNDEDMWFLHQLNYSDHHHHQCAQISDDLSYVTH